MRRRMMGLNPELLCFETFLTVVRASYNKGGCAYTSPIRYLGLYVTRLPEDWTVTSLKGVRFTGLLLTSNRTGSACPSMFFK
jgi:hypothetical protein